MNTNRPSAHAHWRVRETAVAMAHELYDHMMQDNQWYKVWKGQNPGLSAGQLEQAFVDKNLSKLLPQARAVLAKMLESSADEEMKQLIYEALILDATLVKGRVN